MPAEDNNDIWLWGQEEIDFLMVKYPHVSDDWDTINWLIERHADVDKFVLSLHISVIDLAKLKRPESGISGTRREEFNSKTEEEKEAVRAVHRASQAKYRLRNEKMLAEKEKMRRRRKKESQLA
ncbi:hypothetical protein VKT23_017894 [Stygiomarasmius scandens]|uniref:Uncharacterized protein n=1 Tax=Marasmiellus scandens TaxID=2682957 RepID=A0ABR1IR32_9AGAR